MRTNTTIMTDKVNTMEHANESNPCQGICVIDEKDFCIGCSRTLEEKDNWYKESNEWRDNVIAEIKKRENRFF